MLVLKSIQEEAADCRKAFEGVEVGALVLHCHHEYLAEPLNEPADHRIEYILKHKPEHEQSLRLRLFRPVSQEVINRNADWRKAYADWQKANADRQKADADRQKVGDELGALIHFDVCKDCPWDGKTIFPE